jgi:hypothetical protein
LIPVREPHRGTSIRKANPRGMSNQNNRWAKNRIHWETTVDAQNLRGGSAPPAEQALALYGTADVVRALEFMEPLEDSRALALGDGHALAAIMLARRGARVIVADLSLPRLREGRELATRLGLADKIEFVVAMGEHLPFDHGSMDRTTAKSVLIHTDIPATAAELCLVLRPDGAGAFIEPCQGNPFVNLYRALLAPKEWRGITTYFGRQETAALSKPFARAGFQLAEERMYFLAFFASIFAFALRSPGLMRFSERVLLAVDRALLRLLPFLRGKTWFSILLIDGRTRSRKPGKP